jgi:hypothetical protein
VRSFIYEKKTWLKFPPSDQEKYHTLADYLSHPMKTFIISTAFLLLLMISNKSTLNAQDWKTAWGQQESCHPNGFLELLYCDSHNNTYCGTGYRDSIFFGDTSFIHSTHNYNYAISIYNRSGKFVKAIDIYCDSTSEIFYVHCAADVDGNVYICAEFMYRAFLQDTVIYTLDESPDVLVAKLGPDFKVKWAKLISSPSQDDDWGFNLSTDGHLYIACQHYFYPPSTQPLHLYVLGQDTIVFHKLLNTVTKTDLNGTIEWIQQITGKGDLGMFGSYLQIGLDNNIYYNGLAGDDLYVNGDTIPFNPEHLYNSGGVMISFSPDGNLHSGKFEDLVWDDFKVNEHGQFYFKANLYDTMFIGHDTVVRRGDTIVQIVGKADTTFQPLWYHVIKKYPYHGFESCAMDINDDSLIFAIPADRKMAFMDSIYDVGLYNKTFLVQLDPAGNMIHQQFFSSEYDLVPYSLILDHCSNITISGQFRGTAVLGKDTLESYAYLYADGFASGIKRFFNSIDIGSDTVVCDSVTLHGPPGYVYYEWNDGLSTKRDLHVVQTGNYHLAVSGEDHCWMDDTIHVTVLLDQHIELGKDTTIFRDDSLSLSVPPVFSSYEWSTGDTTPEIKLLGSVLGTGDHEIRVRVTKGFCNESDSLKVTVVKVPGIQEMEDALFRVFPVPATAFVTIEIPAIGCEISILDAQGTEVYSRQYNTTTSTSLNLNLSGFKNGIYIVRIRTGDRILVRKLVKI